MSKILLVVNVNCVWISKLFDNDDDDFNKNKTQKLSRTNINIKLFMWISLVQKKKFIASIWKKLVNRIIKKKNKN